MSIHDHRELEVTRKKLRLLEERFAALKVRPVDNIKIREWTSRSLAKMIKQMKEEILRYEASAGSAAANS